jgi:hypothetical protein
LTGSSLTRWYEENILFVFFLRTGYPPDNSAPFHFEICMYLFPEGIQARGGIQPPAAGTGAAGIPFQPRPLSDQILFRDCCFFRV